MTSPWRAVTEHGARAVLVSPESGTITGKKGHEARVDQAVSEADRRTSTPWCSQAVS